MADSETKVDPVSQENARHAIDGAIEYGRQGINPPPDNHWLAPYWYTGKRIASLTKERAEFDSIIDDLGIAKSCINPVEDLKRAIAALKLELARGTRERDEAVRDFKALDELFRLNLSAAYSRAEAAERECEALKMELAVAIKEADGWFDECRSGQCPGLDVGRKLLARSKPHG